MQWIYTSWFTKCCVTVTNEVSTVCTTNFYNELNFVLPVIIMTNCWVINLKESWDRSLCLYCQIAFLHIINKQTNRKLEKFYIVYSDSLPIQICINCICSVQDFHLFQANTCLAKLLKLLEIYNTTKEGCFQFLF